ncbi:MAG: hypothetical protein II922_08610 [Succinimonas sp.]|nr:hypothetical protein [Succinimonas sp.]
MVRPASPDTDFKVALRVTGKYRYAATQPHIRDERSGKTIRRYVYWGEVSEDLRFIPNSRFLAASESERKRLIFPSAWDLSAIDSVSREDPEIPVAADPYPVNDGSAFSGNVSVSPAEEQFSSRLYGGTWFLWQIAAKKHVIADLLEVFSDQRGMVADIMTLAMFLILTGYRLSMLAGWQRYARTPSGNSLTPSGIARLTQRITDEERMRFLSLRMAGEGSKESSKTVVACVLGERSAYACPGDVSRGGANDDMELPQFPKQNPPETVFFSSGFYEPIYYRTFGGNEKGGGNDARTDAGILRAMANELKALKCGDLKVIFVRNDASPENIAAMIPEKQSFLAGCKVTQEPVYSRVSRIKYDQQGMPLEMTYLQEYGIYAAQYEIPWTVMTAPEVSGAGKNVKLTVNLFLDIKERIRILTLINEEIKKEALIVRAKNGTPGSPEQVTALSLKLRHCSVKLTEDRLMVISMNEKAISKARAIAGFFAAVSYRVSGDALSQYRLFTLRSEQEKHAAAMREQLEGDFEYRWPEGGEADGKTGRLFIMFLALILRAEIQAVWERKLREKYSSPLDVLHEMIPIRFTEHADGSAQITDFTASQAEICQAFALSVPQDGVSRHQKTETDRAANRKPGRPRGSLNRKQVRGML